MNKWLDYTIHPITGFSIPIRSDNIRQKKRNKELKGRLRKLKQVNDIRKARGEAPYSLDEYKERFKIWG